MTAIETAERKPVKIEVRVDINAKMLGFEAAKRATAAHRRIMRHYCSPLLFGPPESDAVLELIMHMYTEEEADIAQHVLPLLPITAKQLARRCGRPVENILPALVNMTENKGVLYYAGNPRKYSLLPFVPGLFEMVIVSPDSAKTTTWHKKFAQLFEVIWESGYIVEYIKATGGIALPQVRYLPARGTIKNLQTAWPSDLLDELLDPYDVFAITHCQCRVMMEHAGKGCDKPTENCTAMGPIAVDFIARGFMRRADKSEIIEAKQTAEDNGCVTWMMNRENKKEGNISCSCCGCCCHAMRTINEFSAPGYISTPHFKPRMDDSLCNMCGRCAIVCPMGAWKKAETEMAFDTKRCVGCGLCVKNCKQKALELQVVPEAKKPVSDNNALMMGMLPQYISTSFKIWLRRSMGIL